jgi:uncharacterized protein YndB with AHSA1/START domain
MSVTRDEAGRRSIEMEFAVPGTPEQVWQAIATGPGISSWLFPTEVEEREGGAVAFHIGPGMDSAATVTAWEPPQRFAYEEPDWSPGAPPLGTEFIIEARSGDTCVVRLVHSLLATSETWDGEFEGFEAGWTSYFDVLRLVLRYYRGQESSALRVMAAASGSQEEAWETLHAALGLAGASAGERRQAPDSGVPPFAGIVERIGQEKKYPEVLLRLDEPAPGVALAGAYTWGGSVHVSVSLYLFGERAREVAARDEPVWSAWLQGLFAA